MGPEESTPAGCSCVGSPGDDGTGDGVAGTLRTSVRDGDTPIGSGGSAKAAGLIRIGGSSTELGVAAVPAASVGVVVACCTVPFERGATPFAGASASCVRAAAPLDVDADVAPFDSVDETSADAVPESSTVMASSGPSSSLVSVAHRFDGRRDARIGSEPSTICASGASASRPPGTAAG